jgi:FAD synthase
MFKAFYLSKQAILESLKEERGDANDVVPPAVGMVIGKFSPLTIGHKKMIDQLMAACKQRELIPVVAIIDTGALNNTDRLLTGEERKQMITDAYGTEVEVMVTANAFQALVNVKETGGDLTALFCGEDRVDKYKDLSSHIFDAAYQAVPPDVQVLSRSDADDPTSLASSTKAREAAAKGDLGAFASIVGQQPQQADGLMQLLRDRMGIE